MHGLGTKLADAVKTGTPISEAPGPMVEQLEVEVRQLEPRIEKKRAEQIQLKAFERLASSATAPAPAQLRAQQPAGGNGARPGGRALEPRAVYRLTSEEAAKLKSEGGCVDWHRGPGICEHKWHGRCSLKHEGTPLWKLRQEKK